MCLNMNKKLFNLNTYFIHNVINVGLIAGEAGAKSPNITC